MTRKLGSGPAFPSQISSGMTLRQYIAIEAMNALVSNPNYTRLKTTPEELAIDAGAIADAMIAEDEK